MKIVFIPGRLSIFRVFGGKCFLWFGFLTAFFKSCVFDGSVFLVVFSN